jgi:alkylation response protein AidB-like acyl-CoA dehydrogenase
MFVQIELIRSMSLLAATKARESNVDERRAAISAAKAHVAWSGRAVTQSAIQLHGGIGITDEHNIGLYFKRMHALGLLFGDETHHVRRFSETRAFTASLG